MGGIRAASKLDELGDSVRQVIKAYHGSPYDFDKVDMSKIGMGEGTADEGHGLYVAQHPKVGEYYRDNVGVDRNFQKFFSEGRQLDPSEVMTLPELRRGEKWSVMGSWREEGRPLADLAAVDANGRLIYVKGPGRDATGQWPQRGVVRVPDANEENWGELGAVPLQHLHQTLPTPREYESVVGRRPGHVYELEINRDPKTFLDWDADLSAQTPEVLNSLNQVRSLWEKYLPQFNAYGKSPTGEMIYKSLAREFPFSGGYDKAASRFLFDEGVSGVQYFDQLSRRVGQGTRNYVMFPGTEDSIRILRKYAVPGAILTGAAAGTQGGINRERKQTY